MEQSLRQHEENQGLSREETVEKMWKRKGGNGEAEEGRKRPQASEIK